MRVGAKLVIAAPAERVWESVSDPQQVLGFMSGVTRWEVVSEEPTGLGARYRMLIRVGSAEIGGLIEIVFDEAYPQFTYGPSFANSTLYAPTAATDLADDSAGETLWGRSWPYEPTGPNVPLVTSQAGRPQAARNRASVPAPLPIVSSLKPRAT